MATYDLRFILAVSTFYLSLLFGQNSLANISFVVKIIGSIALFNFTYMELPSHLVMVKKFTGLRRLLLKVGGRFYLTSQELLPCTNLLLKYFSTVPRILFLMTTHPGVSCG